MTNGQEIQVQRTAGVEPAGDGHELAERTTERRVYTPPVDIVESNEDYVLTVDLPGADPASLDVTHENDVLTIRASCPARDYEGYTLAHGEFDFGDYQRAFEISEKVDAERIEAGLKNGVLTIRVPKAKPSRKKVAISTG